MGLYSWLESCEGGFWGAVVVMSAFMIQIPSFGTAQSFSIYNMFFLKYFDDSAAAISLIGSINVGVFLGSGPIATFLMNHMSHRKVALIGATLSCIGLIGMPFAPNIVYMFGFYGVISGLGFCLVYVPSHVLSGLYYDQKRSLATGLATSGSGVGAIIFPLLVNYLVEKYEWRGSFFIVCGISMQNFVFASLLRPVPESLKKKYEQAAKDREVQVVNSESGDNDQVNSKLAVKKSESYNNVKIESELQLQNSKSQESVQVGSELQVKNSEIHDNVKVSSGIRDSDKQKQTTPIVLLSYSRKLSLEDETNPASKNGGDIADCKTLDISNVYLEENTSDPDSQGSVIHQDSVEDQTDELIPGSPAHLLHGKELANEENVLCTPRDSLNEVEKLAMTKKSTCAILFNYAFIIYFINNILWNMGMVIILLFGPQYFLSVALDEQSSATVFSIGGFGAFAGSIVGGIMGNIPKLRLDITYIVITILTGIICLLFPISSFHTFGGLTFLYVAFSVFANIIVGLLVVAVAAIVGPEALGIGMGYVMLANGIGSLAAPPLIGWALEKTGVAEITFYLGGGCIILAGLIIILIPVMDQFYLEPKPIRKKPK